MSLVDKINKYPISLASKIVDRSGMSKYTWAQVCNFASTAPSIMLAAEAHSNGDSLAFVIGTANVVMQGLTVYHNSQRKEQEVPGYVDKTTAELSGKSSLPKSEIKSRLETMISRNEQFEKISAKGGLVNTLNGVLLAVLAGITGYIGSRLPPETTETLSNYTFYIALLSPAILFSGLSAYFRAVPKKK